jgi:hypothetical protein
VTDAARFNNFLLHTWITKWSGACGIEGLRSLVMARMRGGPTLYRKLSEPAPDTSADVSRSMSRRSSATGDVLIDMAAHCTLRRAAHDRTALVRWKRVTRCRAWRWFRRGHDHGHQRDAEPQARGEPSQHDRRAWRCRGDGGDGGADGVAATLCYTPTLHRSG